MKRPVLPTGYRSLVITKAKFRKDGPGLLLSFSLEIPGEDNVEPLSYKFNDVECTHPPHPDLLKCFDKMKLHVILLADFINHDFYDSELFEHAEKEKPEIHLPKDVLHYYENIGVKGYVLSNNRDKSGIMLIAQYRTPMDKVLNIITPFQRLEDAEADENAYSFTSELYDYTAQLNEELKQYLLGKRSGEEQLEIFHEPAQPLLAEKANVQVEDDLTEEMLNTSMADGEIPVVAAGRKRKSLYS
jgi:hypothetical protein